ncbi:MAG: efflux RND transporter periplasmic adaptor subunit [Selenomonadaceae bacterium]|nr:efflux RND transporter periplasmic adaptor subunit [Selenomonadaceae bacterium]MBQ6131660.1 efflux RND transporter periplasmic adaptor subunit [Selenomonadaceae bacterium]MBQ7492800.1 efflux RND transporter periplasmic adaptor subunit [Selenomonadaceae bacterium]
MKKLYMVGLVLILIFAVAMIGYGAWLNKSGEHQITERMENRTIPLQGAKVQVRDMHPTLFLETVNLYSDEMADAVALIDGRIEDVFVSKNSKVQREQIIFSLVNDEIPLKIQQADSSIAKAEAQLANAKNNYARYTRLRDRNATSIEKFDEAEASYFASEAALKEAQTIKEQLLVQSARQDVKAPIDGEILILYKQQGSYVQAGTPLALVGNFSRLFFSLPADDKHAQRLSVGDRAKLSFTNNQILRKAYDTEFAAGNRGDDQVFDVTVKEIVPPLNEPASLRKIVFEIDNRVGLLEQQAYTGVVLKTMHSMRLLTVPLAAMIDSSRSAVFVVTPENTLERRAVKTGADDGNYIEILWGVREGETVVTSAAEGLKEGMKVTVTLTEEAGK